MPRPMFSFDLEISALKADVAVAEKRIRQLEAELEALTRIVNRLQAASGYIEFRKAKPIPGE